MTRPSSHGAAWFLALLVVGPWNAAIVRAHSGPDPISQWYFTDATVVDGHVAARLGPKAKIIGQPTVVKDSRGSSLRFNGVGDSLEIAPTVGDVEGAHLPSQYLTLAVWASVEPGKPAGRFISTLEKDADAERGWALGYRDGQFCFALSAVGADDGNGKLTEIRSGTDFKPDRFYHVVATYDGAEMRLYVDGKLQAESRGQVGPIYQARNAAYLIGASSDRDEQVFHKGLIRDVAVYDLSATDKWVAHEFEHGSELTELKPASPTDELEFVVTPYLQYVTQNQITVMWETSLPAEGKVRFGENGALDREAAGASDATIHEIALADLKPETPYAYQVEATDASGRNISSPLLTFQSANKRESPFAFGVLADMQFNPRVCKILADQLWMQRPNFVIVPGDLTDSGPNKHHWTDHFFPGMQPLASRVAFFPVLGNHEKDSHHYYDYMSLPAPEFYYEFQYGNAQFFMLDSNREVGPDSEQYRWLEDQLRSSTAEWKFVSYHHPSYSSDEDDYGDMWEGERSTYGDLRLRPLSTLYDRYGVDIVWNGHVHSYERTWPLKADRAVERAGTIYMVTGGAGGNLETAGPVKPWFQNSVKHGHHYCVVGVNGRCLEFKAFDLEGRMFDYFKIEKGVPDAGATPEVVASKP